MNTRTIERWNWIEYLDRLSRECMNRAITIEVISEDRGDQVVADHAPLMGISQELKGSDADAVDIELGRVGSTDAFMHQVAHPTTLMVEEDDDGRPLALDFEGEDPTSHTHVRTVVTLH